MKKQNRISKPLTLSEIILYNSAGFAFNIYDTILYAWLAYFYIGSVASGGATEGGTTAFQYIPIMAIGIIMAGGRILDAVTDPLIGYLSDHTKTRWGRRKPYIYVSGPILFLSFVFVWTPPVEGNSIINAIYLAVILFFYYWAYTGLLIPWFAVLPEMSRENKDRVKIASIGVVMGTIGALIGGGLSGPLYEKYGPFFMAVILGAVGYIGSRICLLGINERYELPEGEKTQSFFTVIKEAFADRQVFSFAMMIMFVQLTYQLMLMNVPFLTINILGGAETEASILMAEVIILMAASVPIWYWALGKFPKREVFRVIILMMVTGFILTFFVGYFPLLSPLVQAMVITPIAAIPMGGMFTAVLGIISDITDYDELKTGKRREALYFGIYGIVRKTGWALCSLILSGVFALFTSLGDFTMGVRVLWLLCAVSCLIGLLFFVPYRLGDSKEETRGIMGL